MAKIVSIETLKAERANRNLSVAVPFTIGGRHFAVTKEIVNGEMAVYELSRPIGEMLTTGDLQAELLQKIVLDVELGREEVPLLYTPIYDRMENADFPKEFEAKWAQYGTVVFLEHVEGEEVKFGSLDTEQGPIARIVTWAAGFQYTEDFKVYNQTFNMEMFNRAFGEAHNALLNHIHLNPILSFVFAAPNQTGPIWVDVDYQVLPNNVGAHPVLSMRATLESALQTCATARRPASVLLASSADKFRIEAGLEALMVSGSTHKALNIPTIIYYDGWQITVAKKSYNYVGVATGTCYLIRPKRGFKELIKHDLRVDADGADLSRLIENTIVGRSRRGVYAAIPENVQEITLP